MAFLDWLTTPVATAASGLMGFFGQQETNAMSEEAAQRQMDFQERLSNSAYQRQVEDMKAAGLNPMLAYVKGGGASSPSGAMPTYSSAAQAGVQAALGTAQTRATSAEEAKRKAEVPKIEAETRLTDAQLRQVDLAVDKLKLELENMPKGLTMGRSVSEWNTEAIRFAVEKVKDEAALLRNKATSEDVLQNQMRAYIGKVGKETELLNLDLKAAQEMLNAGRFGKELEPFARMLFSVIRAMRY